MTNEEAIKIFQNDGCCQDCTFGGYPCKLVGCETHQAIDLAIKALEARSQENWTPVSEGLPRRNGVYNVTRIIDETAISDSCYFDGQNTWHRDTGVNHGRPYVTDIIAWQELPEPYKEGEHK